jgi:hypothetical protein
MTLTGANGWRITTIFAMTHPAPLHPADASPLVRYRKFKMIVTA